jgi:hypothetical protein
MAGQVAYHLLAQAGAARAPWPITTLVSWSSPWGPRWSTCCARTLKPRLTDRTITGPRDQSRPGPQPGPPRTEQDRSGTSPQASPRPGPVPQPGPQRSPRRARASPTEPGHRLWRRSARRA